MAGQDAARAAAPAVLQLMKDSPDEIKKPEEDKLWPLTIGSDAGNAVFALTVQANSAGEAVDFAESLIETALPEAEPVMTRTMRVEMTADYLASMGEPIIESSGGEHDGGVMV